MENYIYGQTTRKLVKRVLEHKNNTIKGVKTKFYDAIRKYGWDNFEFSEIDYADTIDKLNYLETYYIRYYNTIEDGYNMYEGGNNNPMFSSIVKKKHKDKITSTEIRSKISNSMKKYRQIHPFTKEHRKHLSEAMKGNKNEGSGDTRSVGCYCIIDNKQHNFHSIKEARNLVV